MQVDGLKELRALLRNVGGPGLSKALQVANKSVSAKIIEAALPNVPVGATGNLRRSVRALASQTGASVAAGRSGTVEYAAAIHWGRKKGGKIAARPFLHDAAAQVGDAAGASYLEAIDTIVHEAGL